jgi:hypothetical protein
MKINNIGSNQTVLTLNDNTEILFSYDTPVAVNTGKKILVTSTKHSKTTSKHIKQWINGFSFEPVPQEYIDNLIK